MENSLVGMAIALCSFIYTTLIPLCSRLPYSRKIWRRIKLAVWRFELKPPNSNIIFNCNKRNDNASSGAPGPAPLRNLYIWVGRYQHAASYIFANFWLCWSTSSKEWYTCIQCSWWRIRSKVLATTKFKFCQYFLLSVWDQATKFKDCQYFRLYGITQMM